MNQLSKNQLSKNQLSKNFQLVSIQTVKDISECKSAEEVIQKSQNLLNETQRITKVGGWEYDVVTHRVTWTDEVYHIHGVSKDYDPSNPANDILFYAPEDQKQITEAFQRAIEKGDSYDLELQLDNAQGMRLWVRTIGQVEYKNGDIVRVFGNIMDITERKHVEDTLRERTDELARSNAELQQFAYIVSHDLQEPPRTISSLTQLLAMRYKNKLDKNTEELMAQIVDGTFRMQKMIEDLLEYSRVGTKKMLKRTDLETVFMQVMTSMKTVIEQNGAVVTHDPLPALIAYPTQMTQLFQNLLSNAIKFRGEEIPRIHVSVKKKGNEWIFSVKDNGIGIAPEFLSSGRLFRLFQRYHSRSKYPGTGIGLAICKKIVEYHGGKIWAESDVGKYSTFYFTLREKID